MEEIIMNILMHSGEARNYAIEAMSLAKSGNFEKAEKYICMADEELGFAHNSQTSLIQGETTNNDVQFSLLLVHSQDHLMTTMTFKDLAVEIIQLHKKINLLEDKL
ncbi:MAG: PTS lactose/cellobiose transporter subunit IIA [Clostridium butyricum]|jgi:PTS system cellobiose-specific IIA component|nr:PTS lactose/cellobiose transporter subunit IIA [Clostridium butyricum]